MRRVWAAVGSVWALLALVAVMAWTRAPMSATPPRATTAIVRTANGTQRVVVLAPPAHATTQTSQTPQPITLNQTPTAVTAAPTGGN
jgi:hypothetical protein